MAVINKYPYTDFENLNLDWLIKEMKELKNYEDNAKTYSEQAEEYKKQTEALKDETAEIKGETEELKEQASDSADASALALSNVNAKYAQMQELYDLIQATVSVPVNEPLELTYEDYYMKASDGTLVTSNIYHITNVITVPAYTKLTFKAHASNSVALLGITDSQGAWIRTGYHGVGGTASTYEYVADTTTYVRLCTNVDTELDAVMTTYNEYEKDVTMSVTSGYINTDGEFHTSNAYEVSDYITLFKGQTLRAWLTGSTHISCLSEWTNTSSPAFLNNLLPGDGNVYYYEYTAPYMMKVRLTARTVQGTSTPWLEPSRFEHITLLFKDKAPAQLRKHPLYRKTASFLGDSMMYGANQGPTGAWSQIMTNIFQMDSVNMAVNGLQLSSYNASNSVEALASTITKDGFIFIEGGANDFNHDVPIADFKASVQNIIDTVLSAHPETCLVFATLYKRYTSVNDVGATEEDYANAMKEVCGANCVKVLDNYHASGIDLHQAYATVFDCGYTYTGTRNYHFNIKAYERLVNNYIKLAETF